MGTAKIQGELWGARAADWAEICEPESRGAYEEVFRRLGVGAGTALLDVGCGAGTALVLARSLGAEVGGLDAAAALVDYARGRLPGARIEVGELEELPFADQSFDVVTGFNTFQFAADPARALAEARRVCKPLGKVAVIVWGPRELCEATTSTVAALIALLPPRPEGAPGPPALSAPGVLEAALERAGLSPTEDVLVDANFRYASAEAACRGYLASGVSVSVVRHAGEAATREAIARSVAPFAQPDGTIVQKNKFRAVIAARRE